MYFEGMTELLKDIRIDPQKLREARGQRTQAEAGRAAGVTKQSIWNYENRIAEPSGLVLAKLCVFYQVPIESLITAESSQLGTLELDK